MRKEAKELTRVETAVPFSNERLCNGRKHVREPTTYNIQDARKVCVRLAHERRRDEKRRVPLRKKGARPWEMRSEYST
jgi:hypothetical protein